MRLGRIQWQGKPCLAIEDSGAAICVSGRVGGDSWRSMLAGWDEAEKDLRAAVAVGQRIENPEWICPLPDPPKFFLLAGNFRAHVVECGFEPLPEGVLTPQCFMKPATALSGPASVVPLVQANIALDYEAELAVIMGRRLARNASCEEALSAVWGYTVVNDISERKLNAGLTGRHMRHNDEFFDWLVGKWFDGSAPLGPWLVSKDEVKDVDQLEIIARLNGEVVQQSPCAAMVHTIGQALVYLSQIVTLEAGDVISMGTPAGVGMARGRLLQNGDTIECEIPGIGKLANRVVDAR